MEYITINEIKKKWVEVFLRNFLQIIYLLVCYLALIATLWGLFNYTHSSFIVVVIISSFIFLPLIINKIRFPIRVLYYLSVIKVGVKDLATLKYIKNANYFNGSHYLGRTYRYIFCFEIAYGNKIKNRKYKVVCTQVDPRVLSLKEEKNRFIVQEKTEIPIVRYKKKVIVLQNDCGFYDLVHSNVQMQNYKQYW